MELKFKADRLRKIAYEVGYTDGLPGDVVRALRMRLQALESASEERILFSLSPWLELEPLGADSSQYSMRVTDDWQLLLEFEDGDDERVAVIEAMVQPEKTTKEHRA